MELGRLNIHNVIIVIIIIILQHIIGLNAPEKVKVGL